MATKIREHHSYAGYRVIEETQAQGSRWFALEKDGKQLVDVNIYVDDELDYFSIHITNGPDGHHWPVQRGIAIDDTIAIIKMSWSEFEDQQGD